MLKRVIRIAFQSVWSLIGVAIGLTALSYVAVTSPLGMAWIARAAGVYLARTQGIGLSVRSLDSDLFSYVRVSGARLRLPSATGDPDRATIVRLRNGRVAFSAFRLLGGEPEAVRTLSVDSLNVTWHATQDTAPPPVWDLGLVAPYLPSLTTLRGGDVRLVSGESAQRIALHGTVLQINQIVADSSALVMLRADGEYSSPALRPIPFSTEVRADLRAAAMTLHSALVQGDGFWLRGWGHADDLTQGPWDGGCAARADLSALPFVDGSEMTGVVDLMSTVDTRDRLTVSASAECRRFGSPWGLYRYVTIALGTEASGRLALTVASETTGGSLQLRGSMPSPADSGAFDAALKLRGIALDSLDDAAALRPALADLSLSGRADLTARISGAYGGDGFDLRAGMGRLDTDSASVAGIDVGDLRALWNQNGQAVEGALIGLNVQTAVTGRMGGFDDVDLTAHVASDDLVPLLHALGVDSISGGARIDVTAQGDLARPSAELRAVFVAPEIYGFQTGTLTLHATVSDNDTLSAALVSTDNRIGAQMVLNDRLRNIVRMDGIVGPIGTSRLPGDIEGSVGVRTELTAEITARGEISDPLARASLTTGELYWNGQGMGDFRGSVSYRHGGLAWDLENGRRTLSASGVLAADSGEVSRVDVDWNGYRLAPVVSALTDHDPKSVGGSTSGSIRAVWYRGIANSMEASARVDGLDVRVGASRFNILNPPVRFTFTRAMVDIPFFEFGDGTQCLRAGGVVQRGHAMDMRVELDSLRIDRWTRFLTHGAVNASGYVNASMHMTGPVERPSGRGYVSATRLKWRSLEVDTLGVRVDFDGNRLALSDILAKFPYGRADGEFSATTPAFGVPAMGDSVPARFSGQITFDKAGAIIPRWEGLRGGALDLSGGAVLAGTDLRDVATYRGRAWVDSVHVSAPYGRVANTAHPFAVEFGQGPRALVEPLQLRLHHREDDMGEITLEHPADTSRNELVLTTRGLSLDNLRHVLHPLLQVTGVRGLPEDLGGFVDSRITWDLDLEHPHVDADVRVIQPAGEGLLADSLLVRGALADQTITIRNADLYSVQDTLLASGLIDLAAETLSVAARTRHLELSNVALDMLPPLRRQLPPPPWPTTLPLPGNGTQMVPLPPDALGQSVNAPLSAFERIARRHNMRTDGALSVVLPLTAELGITGALSSPAIEGWAELPGGFLQLLSVSQPIWFSDTLRVTIADGAASVRPMTIHVGAESQTGQRTVALNRADYSLDEGTFGLDLAIRRTKLTLKSVQPVIVPERMRFASRVLGPLLTSYYSEPIGMFTVDGRLVWQGSVDRSTLSGDIRLYEPTLEMPVGDVQAAIKPAAPTSMGLLLDNTRFELSVITEDSLVIDNNIADGATVGINVLMQGTHLAPSLQGRVDISSGSVFKYLRREFSVQTGTITFPDPEVLAPEVDLQATANVDYDRRDGETHITETYSIVITITGTAPNRLTTEMTMYGPDGTVYTNREDILSMLILGVKKDDINNMAAQDRFDSIIMDTGFATLSSALGTVIPVDRVTVRSEDNMVLQGRDNAEVEVTENFTMFGQPFSLRVITLVSQISALSPATVDLQWRILTRPTWWHSMESLSLTVGTASPADTPGGSIFDLSQNETNADLQLRMRFK